MVDLSLDRDVSGEGYETASSGGLDISGDETLRRLNLEARARRLAEEQARLLEQQERRRIEEERRLYEEFEQQRRLELEKRRQAQAMTSQIIVGSFGTHPVAQQAAQQRQQFVAVTPEMFQQYMDQLRRNSLLVPPQGSKGGDIPIIYTSAEDRARQQGIVPFMSGQGQRLSADDMPDIVHSGISTKRRSSDPPTPKAKAKVEPVEEDYAFKSKTTQNPVKKKKVLKT